MPELPEVETIRKGLEKHLVEHTILDVEIFLPKIVQGDIKNVIGARITGVRRFGKGLVIDLNNGFVLAVHIKLTGQLIYTGKTSPQKVKVIKHLYSFLPNKWTHVIFHLDRSEKLFYNDFRQFGWIKIVRSEDLKKLVFFKELGPELFKDLDEEKFIAILKGSKSPIKPLLMDQKKISGIGNIYANDGLNLARINPQRKANSLTSEEAKRLYKSLETVLKRGLKYGGASELSYVNALGEEGSYQKHFLAYSRDGQKCFNCGGTIKKIQLGGRGTYFCPNCQR